jgi:alanine dehydrogenase
VPRTSTEALTNATLPYVLRLAEHGLDALKSDEALAAGASTIDGSLVCEAVSIAQGLEYTPLAKALP